MGLWNAAMSMETSRHGVQLELSRAWLVQSAECLVLPNHPGRGHPDGGFVFVRFASFWRLARGATVCHHFSGDGCDPGHARLHSGTRTNSTGVAHSADATDLSANAELLHLEGNPSRDQRRLGQLGQTRAHRQRARSRLSANGMTNDECLMTKH